MTDSDAEKFLVGKAAVDEVRDGMVVGLGTGSTASHAIRELGHRVAAGLKIVATATSTASERLAVALGIPLRPFEELSHVDLTIDGADEIDPQLRAIKGRGGALLREKIIAAASTRMIVIADSSKSVAKLGATPLPIEVLPFASAFIDRTLRDRGVVPARRAVADGTPFLTDQGAFIFDTPFGLVDDLNALSGYLDGLPGVLGHGLFLSEVDDLFVARGQHVERFKRTGVT